MAVFFCDGCQVENNQTLSDSFLFFLFHLLSLPPTPQNLPATLDGFSVHTQACSCSGGPCPLSCPRLPVTHEDPVGGNENINISYNISQKSRHG